MANTTKKRPTRRRQKQSKTIDLEVNASEDEKASEAADVVGGHEPDQDSEALESSASGETLATNGADGGDSQAETEAAPIASEPAKKGGAGIGAMLLSGLVGGAVVLGGAGVMNATGNLQNVPVFGSLFNTGSSSSDLEAANQQISDLSVRLEALSSEVRSNDGAANNAESDAQIAALSEKLASLEAQLAEASSSVSAGEAATSTANEALSASQAAAQKADETAAQVAALNDKIVEAAGGGVDVEAVKAALSGETQALASRMDALETRLAESAGQSDNGVSEAVVSELDSIRSQLSALSGLSGGMETLTATTNDLSDRITKTGEELAGISSRLGALETSVNEQVLPSMENVEKAASAAIESQKVARSVSARSLGAVLEQGGKFASELASAEALVGETPAITGLKALADNGIQTEAELLSGFNSVADEILAAETTAAAGDGVIDKFMASAKSLVQVRPAGPVEGDSTSAILSRVEANLRSGDLAAAGSEWENLNEAAKAASQDWASALQNRIQARGLIETVISDLSASQNGEG